MCAHRASSPAANAWPHRRLPAVIGRCRNFDGGFGSVPGAESHAGQGPPFLHRACRSRSSSLAPVFCCVGALAIAGALDKYADADLLGWWLAERQTKNGGLNGRPEKLCAPSSLTRLFPSAS